MVVKINTRCRLHLAVEKAGPNQYLKSCRMNNNHANVRIINADVDHMSWFPLFPDCYPGLHAVVSSFSNWARSISLFSILAQCSRKLLERFCNLPIGTKLATFLSDTTTAQRSKAGRLY